MDYNPRQFPVQCVWLGAKSCRSECDSGVWWGLALNTFGEDLPRKTDIRSHHPTRIPQLVTPISMTTKAPLIVLHPVSFSMTIIQAKICLRKRITRSRNLCQSCFGMWFSRGQPQPRASHNMNDMLKSIQNRLAIIQRKPERSKRTLRRWTPTWLKRGQNTLLLPPNFATPNPRHLEKQNRSITVG